MATEKGTGLYEMGLHLSNMFSCCTWWADSSVFSVLRNFHIPVILKIVGKCWIFCQVLVWNITYLRFYSFFMFLLTSSQWALPLFLCHWLFLLSIFTQIQIILKSTYDQVQYSKCKSCRFWIKINMWQLYNVVLQWCPGLQVIIFL